MHDAIDDSTFRAALILPHPPRQHSMLRDHGCYQSLRQRTPRKQGLRGC